MGMLDEAIREHLELKRRRGADAGEVARQERAVLNVSSAGELSGEEMIEGTGAEAAADESAAPAMAAREQLAAGGDETAELDMESVFGEEAAGAAVGSEPAALTAEEVYAAGAQAPGEPGFEWEVPGEGGGGDAPPPEIPGQEKLSFE
jgi:hypothetical protein